MQFTETTLAGAFVIEPEPRSDERGFFARIFCRKEYQERGLDTNLAQCNIAFNPRSATLRGLHYQLGRYQEVKVVRCTAGAIYDVIVDLRADSTTFRRWFGIELTFENRRMLYVPKGFAHGYLTLSDNTEIFYQVSEFYSPGSERGARWNDPAFGIEWPVEPQIISDKDRAHPDFVL